MYGNLSGIDVQMQTDVQQQIDNMLLGQLLSSSFVMFRDSRRLPLPNVEYCYHLRGDANQAKTGETGHPDVLLPLRSSLTEAYARPLERLNIGGVGAVTGVATAEELGL